MQKHVTEETGENKEDLTGQTTAAAEATEIILADNKSRVKVWVTIHNTHHLLPEEEWEKIKSNEPVIHFTVADV